MKISASEQVSNWLCALPPQTKRRVRTTPRAGQNRGDIRTLFHQVRSNQILLDYANTRDVVYDLYEQILADRKTRKSPHSQAAYNSTAES
jgi:hypothetical protein